MKKIVKLVFGIILAIYMGVSVNVTVYATEAGESVDTSIEKGLELYQSFLDITAPIVGDRSWEELMKTYENGGENKGFFDEAYLNCVADATESQYEEMSAYDTFIYIVTYLKMANSLDQPVFNYYIEKGEEGVETQVDLYTNHWKGDGCEMIKVAYRRFVEWQFAYIRENGYPYNFVTNKSYAEEVGLLPEETEPAEEVSEEHKDPAEESVMKEEELQHIQESAENSKDTISEENQDIQESTQDMKEEKSGEEPVSQKSNVVLPVILVVLLATVAYVVFRFGKKKKDK